MTTPKFHLGLCMAGAISAGAYTAGVLDYLFETLELWEEAKKKNRMIGIGNAGYDPEVPMYDVVIDVINGTSGGGMCGIIGACELLHDPEISFGPFTEKNRLYDAWVNLNDKHGRSTIEQMLDPSDINEIEREDILSKEYRNKKGAQSLFNSSFIDAVCDRVLETSAPEVSRAYVSADLEVAVTTTNLRGMRYSVKFESYDGKIPHYMSQYRQFMQFKRGISVVTKAELPLIFNRTLVSPTGRKHAEYISNAVMATGAFPIGLQTRKVMTASSTFQHQTFPSSKQEECGGKIYTVKTEEPQKPDVPDGCMVDEFNYLAIDGGAMNNEPFDLTRKLLLRKLGRDYNPRKKEEVDCAIILIDPFPNNDDSYPCETAIEEKKKYKYSRKLIPVAMQIMGALRNQPLFRPDDIFLANNEEVYNRFMITPRRDLRTPKCNQPTATASGSLGAFGGFLDRSFREHDFMLGRRNCQKFLREHFAIPVGSLNPIIQYPNEMTNRFSFKGEFVPFIPDMRIKPNTTPATDASIIQDPPFPRYNYDTYFAPLKEGIRERIGGIVDDLCNDGLSSFGRISRFLIGLLAKLILPKIKKEMANGATDAIETSLIDAGLIR